MTKKWERWGGLGTDGSPLRNVLPMEMLEQPPSLAHMVRALYRHLELSWNHSRSVTSPLD